MMNVENCINLDNEFFSVKFTHCYRGLNPDENEGCALSILRAHPQWAKNGKIVQ